jgi:divalent metal cation (Fe/Co/Zn/Cd) transporter
MRAAITEHDKVQRIIHLRTEHIGPDEIVLATTIEFDRDLTMEQLAQAIDEVEARVRAAVPATRLIFVEPDIYRAPASA